MKKTSKTRIWIGVGAFALVGSGVAAGHALPQDGKLEDSLTRATPDQASAAPASAGHILLAQGRGAGGEGSEGGEGGEGQVDPAAVDADPIDYGIALQVIAAHYHAGLLAYESKQREAGAQMFAHGLTEIYVPLEEVFKKRGVTGLDTAMNAAVEAGTANKPVAEVRRRVAAVLDALARAEPLAPKGDKPAMAVKTEVMAEMLERAAAQYRVAADSTDFESYLDGLGFTLTARAQAKAVLPWLDKRAPAKAAALRKALDLANRAYPGIKRPARKVEVGPFLSAASEARLAVSRLP